MKTRFYKCGFILTLIATGSLPIYAELVVESDLVETSCAAWEVSNTDLINRDSPHLVSVTGVAEGQRDAVTDGQVGPEATAETLQEHMMGYDDMSSYSITYHLGNEATQNGYDIYEIATYAGWSNWRVNQIYDVLITTIDSDAQTTLAEVSYTPIVNGAPQFYDGSTRVRIVDNNGEPIARNVITITFVMRGDTAVVNGEELLLGTKYRELDVIGKPSK